MSKDDLGPLPVAHDRHTAVQKAKFDLIKILADWRSLYNLTRAEEVALIAEYLCTRGWSAVRKEREG